VAYFLDARYLPAAKLPVQVQLEVVAIQDGDTLEGLERPPGRSPKTHRIRLASIDCPERSQAFGQVARTFTSDRAFGRTIEVTIQGEDRYGRLLGWVYLPGDAVSLNHQLVAAGLAWHYRRYSDDPGLQRLEDEARAARRGLWADPHPVPPWDYRKSDR